MTPFTRAVHSSLLTVAAAGSSGRANGFKHRGSPLPAPLSSPSSTHLPKPSNPPPFNPQRAAPLTSPASTPASLRFVREVNPSAEHQRRAAAPMEATPASEPEDQRDMDAAQNSTWAVKLWAFAMDPLLHERALLASVDLAEGTCLSLDHTSCRDHC